MRKAAGRILITGGAVLMLSALLLFLYNRYEDARAGRQAERLLAEVQSAIGQESGQEEAWGQKNSGQPSGASSGPQAEQEGQGAEVLKEADMEQTREELSPEMPVVQIGKYGYIGYLSIPSLNLELPVMSEWDYNRLKLAPCRQFGSSRTDDLVIAGHNYKKHFGPLFRLKTGAEVTFTDMEGVENHYTLQKLEILKPEAVDAVYDSGYALVLYTCTLGGENRVVAFCDRVEER